MEQGSRRQPGAVFSPVELAGRLRVRMRRYAFPILAAVFLCVSVAWVYNANSRVIDVRHVDEVHTLVYGTAGMSDWIPDDEVPTQRVGEVGRWFVRVLYPIAIYYMNSRMGGEHYLTGWQYPGGYYLRDRFDKGDDALGANGVANVPPDARNLSWGFHTVDPNIQDYVFFQRTAFSILAVFSFLLLLRKLYHKYGVPAAASYAGFILFGQIVFYQFSIFYSETALFIVFNLSFYCLLSGSERRMRSALLLGLAAAAAMSTKLTGILVAGPAFAHVAVGAWGRGERGAKEVSAFFAAALAVVVALNAPFGSVFSFINETLANVYHYKTGHLVTEEGGLDFLRRLVHDLGYAIVALFLACSARLALTPERRDAGLIALILCIAAGLASLIDSAVYLTRNLAVFYVAMSFVASVGLGRYVGSNPGGRGQRAVLAFCVAVFMVGAADRALAIPSLSGVFFERNAERIAECGSVAAIGVSEEKFRKFVDNPDIAFFGRVRGPFNISEEPEYFDKYLSHDCVVAWRQGQTKQITNFFAPQSHRLASRVGNWFFFDNGGRPALGR